jgi:Ulp1 family protease
MLKNWTKNVNIFAKNYIVVPINEDTHWYLAVIVNPSIGFVTSKEGTSNGAPEGINTANAAQQPQVPVFIFDSLIDAESTKKHRLVAELLLEYLQLEFRDKKNEHNLQGVAYRKNACRIVTPENIPQQQNHFVSTL